MTEEESIKKIEEEVKRLSQQVAQQQEQIAHLQQQINTFTSFNEPSFEAASSRFATLKHSTLENLIGLRLIHLVGIVVLVIGLSLGVKYAIDKNLISEGLRITSAYGAGAVLLLLSLRLKKNYALFSAILFSGAMASIYFTTYGAFVYYHFLSYTAAFVIMIVLTLFTAWQALVYNRQEIALLGLVGAYGIPFLISPNTGSAALLFMYITIINCAIVFLCANKPWAVVGRAAQAISWLLFIGWAVWQNDEGIKTYGLLFMVLFFLLFSVNATSPKLFRKEALDNPASFQLLFNNLSFYVAAIFVFGYSFANSTLALISLAFSVFTALQAIGIYSWKEKFTSKLLAYFALCVWVVFIGFQWKGITVTLLWLLTAVVIFVTGVRLKSTVARMAAITLIGLTLLKLIALDSLRFSTLQKVIAYLVLGVLLLLVSFFYQKTKAADSSGN